MSTGSSRLPPRSATAWSMLAACRPTKSMLRPISPLVSPHTPRPSSTLCRILRNGSIKALQGGDQKTVDQILKDFFFPFVALRNRKKGYAVSIIKAGLKVIGRDPGAGARSAHRPDGRGDFRAGDHRGSCRYRKSNA